MSELITWQELPTYVPGRIMAKSDALGWKGVATRTYAYQGQDVEIPPARDYLLVCYRTGVTPMRRRYDGRWSRETCGPASPRS